METHPDQPAGQGTALRLAVALTEAPFEVVALGTGSRLASELTSRFARDGSSLRNLTAALTDSFNEGQLSRLAAFFESSAGQGWSQSGPNLKLVEAVSLALDPSDSEGDPENRGAALRLAELISADFAMEDESRRPAFLASLTNYLAVFFSADQLERVTSFFESELGRSWREHERRITQSLLIDSGVLGCALAVVAPNLENALEKTLGARRELSEGQLDTLLEELSIPFAEISDSCACVFDEGRERWGDEGFLSGQYMAQLQSLMQELWQSGECPTPVDAVAEASRTGTALTRAQALQEKVLSASRRTAPAAETTVEETPSVASRPEPGSESCAGCIDLRDSPTAGDPGAKHLLIEFCDYQCSYCATHQREVHPEIVTEYVETGRLRVAKVPLPLESIHQQAREAAAAAYCAGEQGKFWEMDERLLWHRERLKEQPWTDHANQIGLDLGSFETCMNSSSYGEVLRYWKELALTLQFTGTPSFVLAEVVSGAPLSVRVLDLWSGTRPFSEVKERIDGVLTGSSKELRMRSLSFPRERSLSLLAPGPLEDAGYEMSAEEESYLLSSEYYIFRAPTMEIVVSSTMGRPWTELDIHGGLRGIRESFSEDEDLREIAYSEESTAISGYDAVLSEMRYFIASMGLETTRKTLVFGDTSQTWIVSVYFLSDDEESEGLAMRIMESVEMTPAAPR